jgi:RNA polymerase sigma-70 factor (ECF subfamily)
MNRLPRSQRHAVALAYVGELTHREIAAFLGEPLGTIKSRIGHGVAKLRTELTAGDAARSPPLIVPGCRPS